MRISRTLYDELIAHARADAPNECCGMIAARDGEAVAVHRARNAVASPLRYEVHPSDLHTILDAIDEDGLELGAIYHSHTRSDPVPSQTDINLANFGDPPQPRYPGALYVIVGVKDAENPDVRTWSIVLGEVSEVELEVVE
jgi:[CysO sulfur-carrier protein]-S-L-cysteine hydrolase